MIDLLIVGGGIAGMCAALRSPNGATVVVLDKGEASAGSSPLAQGGIAAAVGPDDSVERHAADTLAAGVGICDEDVVRSVCCEGPEAIEWLLSYGCALDRTAGGDLDLAREGGQSVARSVHATDATGAAIVACLRGALGGRDIRRVRARAAALLMDGDRCAGVVSDEGEHRARATLLATGGAGALWGATTNAPGAVGDGAALAAAAGAQLSDLEFMQFHPTALAVSAAQRPLLTEALRGEGATLIDAGGERFVDELAPRHVVAAAIVEAGYAALDCRSVADLERRFPTVVAGARVAGFDPLVEPLPVAPAAHYFIGGVATDARGRTSVPGLYAAGESAASGMHGANRMAGNSLLETIVIGGRVGHAAVEEPEPSPDLSATAALGEVPSGLAAIMWEGAGIVRSADSLADARARLAAIDGGHARLCERIVDAARARTETRGVHARADHPELDPGLASRSFDASARAMRD